MKQLLIILIGIHLTGCNLIKEVTGHTIKPQPKCNPTVEWRVPTGKLLITGDGIGESKAFEVLAHAQKTCPDCVARLDAGDIYPKGIGSRKEYDEKVGATDKMTTFPTFRTFGNHCQYADDPGLLVKYSGKCDRHKVTDNKTFWAYILNSNFKTQSQLKLARDYLCSKKGMRILLVHHPFWSNENKNRADEQREMRDWIYGMVSDCVEVLLAGHAHISEVIHRLGVYQHTQGTLGRRLRSLKSVPVEGTTFAQGDEHGFSILDPSAWTLEIYGDGDEPLFTGDVPKK